MTDIQQAAQQALECIERLNLRGFILADFEDEVDSAINALREALAQPEQEQQAEPVAWMSSDRAWMWSDYSKAIAAVANIPTLTLIPLYAAPPQRPWQGLTPEEVKRLYPYGRSVLLRETCEAIEKALKDKNT